MVGETGWDETGWEEVMAVTEAAGDPAAAGPLPSRCQHSADS